MSVSTRSIRPSSRLRVDTRPSSPLRIGEVDARIEPCASTKSILLSNLPYASARSILPSRPPAYRRGRYAHQPLRINEVDTRIEPA